MKASNRKKLCSILIVIDDSADDAVLTRQSKLLHSLYTRGETQQYFETCFDSKV